MGGTFNAMSLQAVKEKPRKTASTIKMPMRVLYKNGRGLKSRGCLGSTGVLGGLEGLGFSVGSVEAVITTCFVPESGDCPSSLEGGGV